VLPAQFPHCCSLLSSNVKLRVDQLNITTALLSSVQSENIKTYGKDGANDTCFGEGPEGVRGLGI